MLSMIERLRVNIHRYAEAFGNLMMESFHFIALFLIAGTVFWSTAVAFKHVIHQGFATIDDVLVLFIYLELGAMVGIYFKTNHMPVRFLIYVGITALIRLLIADIQREHAPSFGLIYVSAATLIFALSALIIRYGSARFPSVKAKDGDR